MGKKIRIALAVQEKLVLMKVLDMPDELRGVGTIGSMDEERLIGVKSFDKPELRGHGIYLWGLDKKQDDIIVHKIFDSDADMETYVRRVKESIREANRILEEKERKQSRVEQEISIKFEIV